MTNQTSADVQEPGGPSEQTDASPLLVGLIALCAGITVSNLYLTQPLLPLVVIDRRGPVITLGVCLLVTIASAIAFLLGGTLLAAIIAAVVLLGIGIQGGMSANQTRILTICPEAGSRMNTVFLVLIFAFGAAGGPVGSVLSDYRGWAVGRRTISLVSTSFGCSMV